MRVLVFGGRDYADRARLYAELDDLDTKRGQLTIINGGATGADRLAREWAKERGRPCITYPADWNNLSYHDRVVRIRRDGSKYDVHAGPRRNQKMIDDGKPDMGVGFPGGAGTRDMLSRIRVAHIQVTLIGE